MNEIDHNQMPYKQEQKDLSSIIIDAKKVDNAVLERLIAEIKIEKENRVHSYNRTHNRHNRGR